MNILEKIVVLSVTIDKNNLDLLQVKSVHTIESYKRWLFMVYLIGLIIFVNSKVTLLVSWNLNAVKRVELTCMLHIDCPTSLRV